MLTKIIKFFLLTVLVISTSTMYTEVADASTNLALEDSTSSVIEGLEVSPKEVNAGGTVTIKVKIREDISGVNSITMMYESPSSSDKMRYIRFHLDKDGVWEGRYTAESYDESGIYEVHSIYITDNAGDYFHFSKQYNNLPQGYITDFTIDNETGGDTESPKIESIEVSPQTVKVGETVIVRAKVTDNLSGVDMVSMTYESPSSGNKQRSITFYQNNGFWEGRYTVESKDESGIWRIGYLQIRDKAGNELLLSRFENNLPQGYITDFTIDNETGGDTTPPNIESIEVSPLTVKVGETVTVRAKVTDDMSGVDSVSVLYVTSSNKRGRHITLYQNNGFWEGKYTVKSFDESGIWKLDFIFLMDKAENILRLYERDNDLPKGNITDFTIDNETGGDTTAPKIESIEVSPLTVKVGETVTVRVKVTDDMSGVDSVAMWYESPSSDMRVITFYQNNGLWEGRYTVRSVDEIGIWKFDSISISDKAGNELFLSRFDNNLPQAYITDFTIGKISNEDLTPPESPLVDEVIEDSGIISGTSEVGSIITVKVGTKVIGTAITTSTGKYNVEIEKQKAGTVLYLTASVAGNHSKATEVVVKKFTAPDDNNNPTPVPISIPTDNIEVIDEGKEIQQKCFHESLLSNVIGCLSSKDIVPIYKQLNNRLIRMDYIKVDNRISVYEEIPQMLGLGGNTWIEHTSAVSYETPSKKMLIKNAESGSRSSTIIWKGLELKSGQIGKVTILEDIVVWETINKNKKSPRVLRKGQQFRVYRYVPSTYYIGNGRYVVKDKQIIFQQVTEKYS